MSLWEPGQLDIKIRTLRAVCEQAAHDHKPGRWNEDGPEPLFWGQMTINEVTHMPADHPDNQFDRCVFAKHNGEVFYRGGRCYRVTDWVASDRWRCEAVSRPDTCVTPRPDILNLSQSRLFELLGEGGNPFVALVEVTYNSKGHRAGYGVRRDGALSCFYD